MLSFLLKIRDGCIMTEDMIKKIQTMPEDLFTKKIVMKLFDYMGYSKVIYNGGVNEYGRDVILWGENKIGNKEVAVAQVKMDKLNSSSSSGSSFITVANQLSMALTRMVPNEDGKEYKPVDVYFVSPQQIDTRQLEMASDIIKSKTELQFIDLPKLLELFDKYAMEEYIYSIFDEKAPLIQDIVSVEVFNDELSNALAIANKKEEDLYYSDLDLSFLNYKVDITAQNTYKNKSYLSISEDNWSKFKSCIYSESREIKELIDLTAMNENFNKYSEDANSNNLKLLKSSYSRLQDLAYQLDSHFDEYYTKQDFQELQEIQDLKKTFEILYQDETNLLEIRFDLNVDMKDTFYEALEKIENFLENINNDFKNELQKTLIDNIIRDIKEYQTLYRETIALKLVTVEEKSYHAIVDYIFLKSYINEIIIKYKNNIIEKKDVIHTIKTLNALKVKILQYNALCSTMNLIIIPDRQDETIVFDKKISDLLNSKIDILIEANAGAGKTTSLQHYSMYGDENLLRIYLPLTKILKYLKLSDEPKLSTSQNMARLLSAICEYFNKANNTFIIDVPKFKSYMLLDTTVLLFDGLDEVLSEVNWIFDTIQSISSQYACTIAVTTRPGFIKDYEIKSFMKLKLLDFNQSQREKFVKGWFHNDIKTADTLLEHIEANDIGAIISNPFSATIFCRLAERNVPLPTTETDMYEERLKLLLGEYDAHKAIKRNTIYRLDLEKVAIKIAFIFHKNNVRSMSLRNIFLNLKEENIYLDEEDIQTAVEELIVPCNILFDEYGDQEYTFGHFRYQEYLVAKELQRNRGIDIFNYIHNSYWKGALSLFAQITDDMIHIIEVLVEQDYSLTKSESILFEMISKRRSQKERTALTQLVQQFWELDNDDIYFNEE